MTRTGLLLPALLLGGCASGGGFPARVLVLTNEPFWQLDVGRETMRLTGVDAAPRMVRIERRAVTDGVLRVEGGGVAATVSAVPCEDDMSGARYPMTAMLSVGETGPFRGCARDADGPRPVVPGEEERGSALSPPGSASTSARR